MFISLILLFFLSINSAVANVVTTLPELAWLAQRLVGDAIPVDSLLSGTEDPHFVDPSPAFIFKVAKAEILIFNGLDLEIGWLPRVIDGAGNKKVQRNSLGYCDASDYVDKVDVLEQANRAMGDVHPAGNPHYVISPAQLGLAARKIKECLSLAYPDKALAFEQASQILSRELSVLLQDARGQLLPLKGKKLVTYHREFAYLFKDLGIELLMTMEQTPGVLPSAAYLAKVAEQSKSAQIKFALATSLNPSKYVEKFGDESGIPVVIIPGHLKRGEDFKAYFQSIVTQLLEKIQPKEVN